MNKESIYKIIGYQGEYSTSVKKAIRKLLKDNHPDNNGNSKIFEIINEVKDELENNRVSYNIKNVDKKEKLDDIDYDYCYKMRNKISLKRNKLLTDLKNRKDELLKLENTYGKLYRDTLNTESKILSKSNEYKKIDNIKMNSIIIIIVMVIIFILALAYNSMMLLAIFVLLAIVCILIIQNYFNIIHDITMNNKLKLKSYIDLVKEIRFNTKKQESLNKDIYDIKKNISKCENDLRFYNNLLK